MDDSAISLLLADAKSQGLTIREYEDRYGILLMPAQQEIARHETVFSDMADGWHRKTAAPVAEDGGSVSRVD